MSSAAGSPATASTVSPLSCSPQAQGRGCGRSPCSGRSRYARSLDTTLLDIALDRVAPYVPPRSIAVNAHHLAEQVVAHVRDRAWMSVEAPDALGTAGAVGELRGWLDGRDLLIANGDVCFSRPPDLAEFVADWDRVRPRLLVVEDRARADFEGEVAIRRRLAPPRGHASSLPAEPAGLYEAVWRDRRSTWCRPMSTMSTPPTRRRTCAPTSCSPAASRSSAPARRSTAESNVASSGRGHRGCERASG